MGDYRVTIARSARKELERLQPRIAERIMDKIESLSSEPRPMGTAKLQAERNLWRIRVGEYRVVYSIDDAKRAVDISIVRHRRDVYRPF